MQDAEEVQNSLLPPAEKKHSTWPPFRLGFIAILVSFGSSFNFGFQLLITNPAQQAFISFLNDSKTQQGIKVEDVKSLENEWSLIVAVFFLGSIFGAFLIRAVSENFGRKNGLIISVTVQIISCLLAIFSYFIKSYQVYTVSRLLMGIGITKSMGISAMFITESSPVHCRGVASILNGIILQFSIIVGSILAMPKLLGTSTQWYLLYVFQLIISFVVLISLPWIHDSPGYLNHRGKKQKAVKSVEFYHSVSKEVAETVVNSLKFEEKKSLLGVWGDAVTRKGTILGMLVSMGMAMTGISVINAFAFEILLNTGLEKFEASIANVFVCTFSLAGILVSTRIIDHHGRRPLLLCTFMILAVVNCMIVGLMYFHKWSESPIIGYLLVATICLFNFIFAMGPGPVSLFLSGELVSQAARSASSTWSNSIMATFRFFCLALYLPLKNATSEYTAYATFFIFPMIFATIVLYFKLPETKGDCEKRKTLS
ncbi:unnamed protein product [Caenorhabditis angaria]|uniref:Major facilitator superfamily (MFS) profile domain-containing protein n=1 Tax=Caenorhabditis angaria TaxID=860376 RepID=A0A9P1N514_9PELO|nr:unnamed protein product [Caenorhabditis angaria]